MDKIIGSRKDNDRKKNFLDDHKKIDTKKDFPQYKTKKRPAKSKKMHSAIYKI